MKQTHKDQWIRLLRSNRYKQCYGKLQEPYTDQRCAIGVCFEVIGLNKNRFIEESLKLGLSFKDIATVSRLNDVQRKTFDEIANYIEQNIRGE